jgi:cell division protein FtsW
MKEKKPFDFWIFISVLILLTFGIIMLFSASTANAYNYHQDTYYFLKKQLVYGALGFLVMLFVSRIDYHKLGKISPILIVITIILLILVRIPGIGRNINGSWRWIYIGPQSIQPSELLKITMILFLAFSLSKRKDQLQYFFKGLLPYLMLLGLFAGLLLLEPHLSCTILIVMVGSIMLFCAGAKIKHFVLMITPAIAGLAVLISTWGYMQERVLTFLNPWEDKQGSGWQVIQSLYAIGSGGWFGRGLGKSLQKFLYLPEPHNDFIFSVMAEELGFIGVVAILMLFFLFIWRGVKVSISAPDVFGSLVAIGITSLIAIQVIINVGVVTSSMPATGMPLPFFSYGGTSLLFLMCEIGILLNISKYAKYDRI